MEVHTFQKSLVSWVVKYSPGRQEVIVFCQCQDRHVPYLVVIQEGKHDKSSLADADLSSEGDGSGG